MPDLPGGPDDEVTPVDLESRRPPVSPPLPSPHPSPSPSRDTARPHPSGGHPFFPTPVMRASPRPNYPMTTGPEPGSSGGIATPNYVKTKLRKQAGIGGSIVALLTTAGGLYENHKETVDAEDRGRLEQKLKDHIDTEAGHYSETTKRLDQLIELELKRGK